MLMRAHDLLRSLRRLATRRGWEITEREGKGSHLVMRLDGRRTTIPMHRGNLPEGTYRAILKQLGITPEDLED